MEQILKRFPTKNKTKSPKDEKIQPPRAQQKRNLNKIPERQNETKRSIVCPLSILLITPSFFWSSLAFFLPFFVPSFFPSLVVILTDDLPRGMAVVPELNKRKSLIILNDYICWRRNERRKCIRDNPLLRENMDTHLMALNIFVTFSMLSQLVSYQVCTSIITTIMRRRFPLLTSVIDAHL